MKKLRKRQLPLYALAGFGPSLINTIITIYLVDALQKTGFVVNSEYWTFADKTIIAVGLFSILKFLAQLVDGIIDVPFAALTDNMKTKWGKRRPAMLLGLVPMILSYVLFCFPVSMEENSVANSIYCGLLLLVFYSAYTLTMVTYYGTYSEVTALQRAAGAISIWAHPTSWWDGPDGRYYTNIAAAMPPNLYADGFLDGLVVQGYDPYHRDYQALWFDLLDRGWRVPGFSELDLCPCREIRGKGCALFNCVPGMASHGGDVTLDAIIAAMRAANHTMSSGPYLTLSVDGVRQGGSVRSGAGVTHVAVVEAWPAPGQSALARVELLGSGGTVLASVDDFPGGRVTFMFEGDANGGWVAARVFGEHDGDYASKRQQAVLHCALTNPVVLDAPHTPHPAPVTTHVRLSSDGCEGASLRLVAADGSELWRRELPEAGLEFDASPTSRLEIGQPDGAPSRVLPLAAANRRVRDLMDYLADGRFRRDWPGLEPGEVPVAAFNLDGFRTAMTELVLSARKA